MEDVIKKPKHYCDGRKYEPKDVIRDWKLNFNLGSAMKYIARAGRKDNIVQEDLLWEDILEPMGSEARLI